MFVDHGVRITTFAGQHRDNTLLDYILFSRDDGYPMSRYMSTVYCYMLPACIALLKTWLLDHDLVCSKIVVYEEMKQKPRFERGF